MATEFKVPELGEGVESATVAKVLVEEGDTVEKDQPVVELESDKAVAEVPCETAGTVTKVHVSEGDEVEIGQVLLTVQEGAQESAGPSGESDKTDTTEKTDSEEGPPAEKAASEETKDQASPKPSRSESDKPAEAEPESKQPAPPAPPGSTPSESDAPAPAAPSVRRFAREIGVDIARVRGSGPNGRISIDDVKAHSRESRNQPAPTSPEEPPLPDFSRWGETSREAMSKVRGLTAQHVASAWRHIPHVTQFDKADVTDLEAMRRRASDRHGETQKLSMTAVLLKVVAHALRQFPRFNASVDMANQEIVYKHYVNLGVAADTDRGLVVPVIRNADRKSIAELSQELGEVIGRARDGKLTADEMQGGTFSISNAGALGGGAFTPIVNGPEVAILGVGRARAEVLPTNGEFAAREVLPLGLSYDHRVVDGADGVRFLRWIVEALEDPSRLLWQL